MKQFKEILRKLLMLIAICAIIFSSYQLYLIYKQSNEADVVDNKIEEIIGKDESEDKSVKYLTEKSYAELAAINADLVGYLYYPSLDIHEVVTQSHDNAYYLDRSFYKDSMVYGTVFMSYDQTKESQNQTLYGHWIQNSTKKFSNLHQLRNQENYEASKTFFYADDEYVYEYEVVYVIYHETYEDDRNVPYWQGDFTDAQFEQFVENAEHQRLYDTQTTIERNDRLMSLQTCITYNSEERLVIIGKEVARTPLEAE